MSIEDKNSQNSAVSHLVNELKTVKEQLANAERNKNENFRDMMNQYQSMNDMILRNEKEYFGRLR